MTNQQQQIRENLALISEKEERELINYANKEILRKSVKNTNNKKKSLTDYLVLLAIVVATASLYFLF